MIPRILDKLFLLGCSTILYYFTIADKSFFILIPVALVTFFCCVGTILNNIYLNFAIYLIYLGICCFLPLFTIFIPVILYELLYTVFKWSLVFCVLPFILFWDSFSFVIVAFTALFLALSVLLYYKTSSIELLQNDYKAFRKTANELALVQDEKNQSILENQDYEIQTATLNERNRISKEIHDHIGHLLSRSLIQIGALLTISKEELVREALVDLKSSISEGMDSIRSSIHNMHDESIDLERSIKDLIKGFTLCSILYEFSIHFPPALKVKYCFIAITKESLANIIKHGHNVNNVSVTVLEENQSYTLTITDDGAVLEKTVLMILKCQSRCEYPEGLGLQSISDRVKSLNGTFHITTDNGFKLFICIPKEELKNESASD